MSLTSSLHSSTPITSQLPDWQVRLLSIDTRALAVLRIGMGVLILVEILILRTPWISTMLSDHGAYPREAVSRVNPLLSLYFISGSALWSGVLLAITALAAVGLIVGWRWRLMILIAWYLLRCLGERTPMASQGGDALLRMLLLWSLFLPMGARWSLRKACGNAGTAPAFVCHPGSVVMLLQVAGIYAFTVISKDFNSWWHQGDLLWWTVQDARLTPSWADSLRAWPGLLKLMIRSAFMLECLAPIAAFWPWRTEWVRMILVPVMMGFHLLGISVLLSLGLFPWVSALSWVVFLPPRFWESMERGLDRWRSIRLPSKSTSQPQHGITQLPMAASACLWALLFFMLTWHVGVLAMHQAGAKMPAWLTRAARTMPIHQAWDVFCRPVKRDRFLVVAAKPVDGDVVALHQDGRTASAIVWDKSALPPPSFMKYRWARHVTSLSNKSMQRAAESYARWLARRWEQREHRALGQVEIWRVIQPRQAPDASAPPEVNKEFVTAFQAGFPSQAIHYDVQNDNNDP